MFFLKRKNTKTLEYKTRAEFDEVLRKVEEHAARPRAETYYKYWVCLNCGEVNEAHIPKGQRVKDTALVCGNCGCC